MGGELIFALLSAYVKLGNELDEFYVPISPSTNNNSGGKQSVKMVFINNAVAKLVTKLRHKDDYIPVFLKDDNKGNVDEVFLDEGGVDILDVTERAYLHCKFLDRLTKGIDVI